MRGPDFLETPQGRRLAFHRTEGRGPWVVFLGGLKSDMEGTKALHLEAWCAARGQGFLRFDYSGHGQSSGTFEEGAIGDWAEDTAAALGTLTQGKLVVVGGITPTPLGEGKCTLILTLTLTLTLTLPSPKP